MTPALPVQVIETIHEQQLRDQAPNAGSLARELGVRPTQVAEAMLHLERRGLVDASRARLTLPGLAVAAALVAARARRVLSNAA